MAILVKQTKRMQPCLSSAGGYAALECTLSARRRAPDHLAKELCRSGTPSFGRALPLLIVYGTRVSSQIDASQCERLNRKVHRFRFFESDVEGEYSMATVEQEPEVLTAKELADFLRVPESTVQRYASRFGLPGRQLDGDWRFWRVAVQEWLRGRSGKEVLLSQAGALEDDQEDLRRLRTEIYRDRGRPEAEETE